MYLNWTTSSHRMNTYYNGKFGDLDVDFNADFFTSENYDDRTVTSENNVQNRLTALKNTYW